MWSLQQEEVTALRNCEIKTHAQISDLFERGLWIKDWEEKNNTVIELHHFKINLVYLALSSLRNLWWITCQACWLCWPCWIHNLTVKIKHWKWRLTAVATWFTATNESFPHTTINSKNNKSLEDTMELVGRKDTLTACPRHKQMPLTKRYQQQINTKPLT